MKSLSRDEWSCDAGSLIVKAVAPFPGRSEFGRAFLCCRCPVLSFLYSYIPGRSIALDEVHFASDKVPKGSNSRADLLKNSQLGGSK